MFRLLSYNHLQGAALTHKNICGVKNLNTCIFFVYQWSLKFAVVKEPKRAGVVSYVYKRMKFFMQFVGNKTYLCVSVAIYVYLLRLRCIIRRLSLLDGSFIL
jgi:hypothetical protein